MDELKIVPDVMIPCKLLKKEIPQDLCYEVNLVLERYAKQSFVPEVEDWGEAEKLCPECPVSYYNEGRRAT